MMEWGFLLHKGYVAWVYTSLKMLTITDKKNLIKLFKSLKINRQVFLLLGTENEYIHLYSENVMVPIFLY